jgi:phage-related protein/predicted  nucleic acid-binding Zn-ribbon protein
VAEGNAGSAVFRAIADFAALRRESKSARDDLKNLGNESDKTSRKVGDTEKESNKAGNGFSRLSVHLRKVKADMDRFRSSSAGKALDDVAKAAGRMLSALGGIGTKVAKFSLIAAAGTAALGPILSLVGAIAQLSGAAGALPAVLGAGIAAAGTLATGMIGLKDAFKPVAGAVGGLASAQKAADRASIQGAEQVRSARQRLADAYVEGARKVQDAERALARAQRDSVDAQKELNQAREDAKRQLQDLGLQLTGAALDQKQAVLDLARAQQRLQEVAADPQHSALDLSEAQLGVEQAKQAIEEISLRYKRLQEESDAANKAGVEGADNVVAAQRTVADTTQAVADAQEGLKQAQVDSARAVSDAQHDLAMAIQQAAWAQQDAATSMAAAAAKTGPVLAASAKAFVDQIKALKPAWESLRLDVQEKLFAGIAEKVRDLAGKYLPLLHTAMGGMATTFNDMAKSFADWLGQRSTVDDFGTSLNNINGFWSNLRGIVKPLSQAFLDIFKVGSEFLPEMGKGISGVAQKFADFIHNARESGKLKEWIGNGIQALKDLGGALVNIGRIFGAIFKAGQAEGHGFLQTLRDITGKIADFLNSAEGQDSLRKLFQAISDAAAVVGPILKTLFKTFADILPILVDIGQRIGPGVQKVIEGIGKAFEVARPGLEKLASAFGDFLKALGNAGPLIGTVVNGIANVLSPVIDALTFVIKTLTGLFNLLPQPVKDVIGGMAGAVVGAGLLIVAFKKVMDWGSKLIGIFGDVTKGIGKMTDSLGSAGDASVAGGGAVGGKDKKTSGKKTKSFGLVGALVGVASATVAFDMGAEAMKEFSDGATSKAEATRDAIGAALMGGAGIAAQFGPWGLVVAAALAAGAFIISHWQQVADFFGTIGSWIGDRAVDVWNFVTSTLSGFGSWVSDVWSGFWSWAGTLFSDFGSWVSQTASDLWNWITSVLGGFGNWVGSVWSGFWSWAGQLFSDFGSWVAGVATDAWNGITTALGHVGDWLSSTWSTIWEGAKSIVKSAADAIGGFVSDMVRKIGDLLSQLATARQLARDTANDPSAPPGVKLTQPGGLGAFLGLNKGGLVPGKGHKDTVAIAATPGEYVMPEDSTERWLPLLKAMNPHDQGGAADLGMSAGDLLTNAASAGSAAAGWAAGRAVASSVRHLRSAEPAGGPTIGSMSVTQVVHNPSPEKPSVSASKKMARAANLGATVALKGVA